MMEKINPILDSKHVCKDLVERLQAQLPPSAQLPKPLTPVPEKRFQEIEDNLKLLQAKLEEVVNPPKPTPAENEKLMADKITQELADIVGSFNASFEDWRQRTGCVVNFSWGYANGGKKLEIAGIDYIVYRKPAPSEKTLQEVLQPATAEK
jgi:hypothetical protein